MNRFAVAGTCRFTPPYDDMLDVLRGFLVPVPVDAEWYKATYPAVAGLLIRMPGETPASHFQKHGYFEGRKPFAPGWCGLIGPVPFEQLKVRLRLIPTRGRLRVDIEHDDFLAIIKNILMAIPVDETWYRANYPDVRDAIDHDTLLSMTYHYAERGYFEGRLPFAIEVDAAWYISRYGHVRTGLERGEAESAQDHFTRLGYHEGCRPTPP